MVNLRFVFVLIFVFSANVTRMWADELSYASIRPQMTVKTSEVDLDFCFNRLRPDASSANSLNALFLEQGEVQQNFPETLWDNKIHQAQPGGFFSDAAFMFNALPEEANLESKLFLSRNLGNWNLATHFVLEKEFKTGSPVDLTCVVSLSHPLTNSVQFGVEYFDQPLEGKRYLVPGVYSKIGDFTLNVGLQWGLNHNDDTIGVRSLMTWDF